VPKLRLLKIQQLFYYIYRCAYFTKIL